MKKLERGEKVTVWTTTDRWRNWSSADSRNKTGRIVRGRAVQSWRNGGALVRVRVGKGWALQRIFHREEGKIWVRGWDTDEAKAFAVTEALR